MSANTILLESLLLLLNSLDVIVFTSFTIIINPKIQTLQISINLSHANFFDRLSKVTS
jgi:hypothetical protein